MRKMTSDRKLRLPLTLGMAMIAKLRSLLARQYIERYSGALLIGILGIGLLLRLPRHSFCRPRCYESS